MRLFLFGASGVCYSVLAPNTVATLGTTASDPKPYMA